MPTRENAVRWLARQHRARSLAASLGLTHTGPKPELPDRSTMFPYRGVLIYCYRLNVVGGGTQWACSWEGDNRSTRLTYDSAIVAVDAAEREIDRQLAN